MQPSHSIVDLRSGFMTNTDTGPTSKQNKYGQPFNAQLHRGAIIYVIKASGQNVLLLRATSAYRYVVCRGIVSPPPPLRRGHYFARAMVVQTPIAPRPDSTLARLLHPPKKGDSSNAAIHSSIATFGSRISDFGVRNIVLRLTR